MPLACHQDVMFKFGLQGKREQEEAKRLRAAEVVAEAVRAHKQKQWLLWGKKDGR